MDEAIAIQRYHTANLLSTKLMSAESLPKDAYCRHLAQPTLPVCEACWSSALRQLVCDRRLDPSLLLRSRRQGQLWADRHRNAVFSGAIASAAPPASGS